GLLFSDLRLLYDVPLPLIIDQRDIGLRLSSYDTGKHLSALKEHHRRPKARRNRPARFQNRFDDVNSRKTAAHSSEFWTDPLPLVANAMTFEAQRFFGVEKDLAAPVGISRA